MKFALLGTGFIMPRHAEAIYRVGGKITDFVNTAYGEDAWKKVIPNTHADCVVILTPNDLHAQMALAARNAGKIVLCEKPLALSKADVQALSQHEKLFVVLQLRHHPLAHKLKKKINTEKEYYNIEMDISNYRDESYYNGWKGNVKRSGGILFNLGSHYFDMLIHLFGKPTEIVSVSGNDKTMEGVLRGTNYECRWKVSSEAKRGEQHRIYKINGIDCNFSSQENLSQEQLHVDVYRELLKGRGITPTDTIPYTETVEAIYRLAKNKS